MHHKLILTTATLALFAGCNSSDSTCDPFAGCLTGGVGGGGGTGGLILINRDNALGALREAWFAAATTPAIPTFVEATGVGTLAAGTVVVDPNGPTVYNCPTSGTFTVTGNVADPDTVTAGDNINYESSACDSGTGYTVDGDHSVDISSVAGDVASGQYELGQILTFTGFSAASATLVTTLDGDYTAVTDSTVPGSFATAFSGNAIRIGEDQVTIALSGYSGFAELETVAPFNYYFDVAGRASGAGLGSFDYWTAETMSQQVGSLPFDGMLDVFGTNGSTARLAVEDGVGVIVQVDENGNDNFEISVITTWEEFLAGTVNL